MFKISVLLPIVTMTALLTNAAWAASFVETTDFSDFESSATELGSLDLGVNTISGALDYESGADYFLFVVESGHEIVAIDLEIFNHSDTFSTTGFDTAVVVELDPGVGTPTLDQIVAYDNGTYSFDSAIFPAGPSDYLLDVWHNNYPNACYSDWKFIITVAEVSEPADYILDNGSPDMGYGPNPDESATFVNNFTARSGFSEIVSVDAFWSPAYRPKTTEVTAGVWSDPNQDGNPDDAVLLGSSAPTLSGAEGSFQTFDLLSPIDVGPAGTSFFVGVYWTDDDFGLSLGMDTNPKLHRSWTKEYLGDPLDPNDLSGADDYTGNFMIRAHATESDEPTIGEIIEFFDENAGMGIQGRGFGWFANLRLSRMRELLVVAGVFIDWGWTTSACPVLDRAYKKCDGEPWPSDFVVGDEVGTLADMIDDLMEELCVGD